MQERGAAGGSGGNRSRPADSGNNSNNPGNPSGPRRASLATAVVEAIPFAIKDAVTIQVSYPFAFTTLHVAFQIALEVPFAFVVSSRSP
uniref:Uncharacterized protein n=1 Tax=Globisporangium ultimum (strain ATCC 200006 / CBS 805.95 / DAOM BR144) TaxID=431595 RepID=K3XAE3_GLOUD